MAWVTAQQWRQGVFQSHEKSSVILFVSLTKFADRQAGGGSTPTVNGPILSMETNTAFSPTDQATNIASADGGVAGEKHGDEYDDPSWDRLVDQSYNDITEAIGQGWHSERDEHLLRPSSLCFFCRY